MKHNYHIRINPHAVALVDEGCPQETIDALCKMSELVLKKYDDKSNVKTSVTSGGDGLVNLQTPPSFKTLAKSENSAENVILNIMKKLIDLDDQTFETLSIMAIKEKTNLKSYIESVLVLHAGGGFKDKKPSTERTKKR